MVPPSVLLSSGPCRNKFGDFADAFCNVGNKRGRPSHDKLVQQTLQARKSRGSSYFLLSMDIRKGVDGHCPIFSYGLKCKIPLFKDTT